MVKIKDIKEKSKDPVTKKNHLKYWAEKKKFEHLVRKIEVKKA